MEANLTPKNWATFQHYKDRAPSWIKLHKSLLDDYAFHCLPVASKALAPCLWLLASEYEDGKITASMSEIGYRLRMGEAEVLSAIKPLIESGFFISDSISLADCKQSASLEKRERTSIEEGECAKAHRPVKRDRRRATQYPEGFSPDFAKATSAGLSRAEAEREALKFKNHAVERGRTCIDWQAAWHNWCLKAAEFMGRRPQSATPTAPAIPTEDYLLRFKSGTVKWNSGFGPEPHQPGCRVPRELLIKHGYIEAA